MAAKVVSPPIVEGILRVSQGGLLRNVEYIEYIDEREGVIEVSKVVFPLVVVLTQDCDLAQHVRSNDDKKLVSVLVAPLYNMDHIMQGEHLSGLNRKMTQQEKSWKNRVMQNQIPRYHYLEFPDSVPIVASVVDFKHYFSVGMAHLVGKMSTRGAYQLDALYREDLSHRFASYLSRIGLPEDPQ